MPWCAGRYHLLLELLQRKGVAGGTRVLLLHVLVCTGCVGVGAVLRGGVPPPLERALIVGVITLSFAFFVSIRCAVVPPRKGTPQVGHTQQIVGLVYL